jgi:hypothetical protein
LDFDEPVRTDLVFLATALPTFLAPLTALLAAAFTFLAARAMVPWPDFLVVAITQLLSRMS